MPRNRSYRRFDGSVALDRQTLVDLIDLARCSPSGANIQPLKYHISVDADLNARIYPTLAWAGYLADWDGPEPAQRPAGYITILHDTRISKIRRDRMPASPRRAYCWAPWRRGWAVA